jgi:hypothetical protein
MCFTQSAVSKFIFQVTFQAVCIKKFIACSGVPAENKFIVLFDAIVFNYSAKKLPNSSTIKLSFSSITKFQVVSNKILSQVSRRILNQSSSNNVSHVGQGSNHIAIEIKNSSSNLRSQSKISQSSKFRHKMNKSLIFYFIKKVAVVILVVSAIALIFSHLLILKDILLVAVISIHSHTTASL